MHKVIPEELEHFLSTKTLQSGLKHCEIWGQVLRSIFCIPEKLETLLLLVLVSLKKKWFIGQPNST